jgi:hypothetical protein
VALVTSLRDGMNLVSYEYVACQSENAGVLILSEFAGAAQSLGAGSILVNPWNISDMAQARALHDRHVCTQLYSFVVTVCRQSLRLVCNKVESYSIAGAAQSLGASSILWSALGTSAA